MNDARSAYLLRHTGRVATDVLVTTAIALALTVRVLLFSVLAMLEPVVRWVLSFCSLAGFGCCAFYALCSPPGVHFPYWLGLTFGIGGAVLLALYEMLLRALQP